MNACLALAQALGLALFWAEVLKSSGTIALHLFIHPSIHPCIITVVVNINILLLASGRGGI